MKKNLILLILSLFFIPKALAETTIPWTKEGCESVKGTWITAHSATDDGCDAAHCNSMNFCISNVSMNLFSALIWCQSIGRKLASLDHACPGIPTTSGPCANLNLNTCKNGWTSMTTGTNLAFIARLKNGYAQDRRRDWDNDGYQCGNYALCE